MIFPLSIVIDKWEFVINKRQNEINKNGDQSG